LTDRFATGAPRNGTQLAAELLRLHEECETYLRSLPADVFVKAQGEKWSPAEHVRHLSKSVRPVALALGLPRFVLWLRFGRAAAGSRSFEVVRETYLARLAAGATAGRFTPSPQPAPKDTAAYREGVLTTWRAANADLRARIARWNEAALDRYVLPHPALGRLTVREMLFFTLYHNAHHLNLVAGRAR
jgi:DinB superfamily